MACSQAGRQVCISGRRSTRFGVCNAEVTSTPTHPLRAETRGKLLTHVWFLVQHSAVRQATVHRLYYRRSCFKRTTARASRYIIQRLYTHWRCRREWELEHFLTCVGELTYSFGFTSTASSCDWLGPWGGGGGGGEEVDVSIASLTPPEWALLFSFVCWFHQSESALRWAAESAILIFH